MGNASLSTCTCMCTYQPHALRHCLMREQVTRLDLYIIRFCANERVYGYGGTHIYVPGMCLQFENL